MVDFGELKRGKGLIIACEMIRDEVNLALKESGCDLPLIWISAELHLHPEKLKTHIEELLGRIGNIDYVLCAFGYCGNIFIGQKPPFPLIIPRYNDCTEIMLCKSGAPTHNCAKFYLTKGWLTEGRTLKKDYARYVERYGEKRAGDIMEMLFANYKTVMLIDTGAYPFEEYKSEGREIADLLKLGFEEGKGSIEVLTDLFAGAATGNWDNRFAGIPAHTEITYELLGEGKTINIY